MRIPDAAVLRAPHLRGARALFTTRDGGVGEAPFDTLNLALHVGDDEGTVLQNRARIAQLMGAPLAAVEQVHSARVATLPPQGELPLVQADALVTRRRDTALMIMVADCLPVLLVDEQTPVIGAAHAGRRGLLDGILENTVRAMEEQGAVPGRIRASIGPSICGRCYEVPQEMQDDAAARLPASSSRTGWGTPALDLRAGAVQALLAAGLVREGILAEAPCTREDPRFFSYRRAARTGRIAGVIRLQ
ncbi:peptidoglycan editing factor PgeF [Brachybacterium hainanense]|uniref:Purine nucleoside phosphorylase n=1 Tax=Brachybacterium hainanense TaxID=1541174 RepID=A0ABV6RFP3_9MICO